MTITTRASKGSALTYGELDGNFTDLDGRVTILEDQTLDARLTVLEDQTIDTRITALETTPKIPVFANTSIRDTTITTPEDGMIVLTNSILQVYNGSWIDV